MAHFAELNENNEVVRVLVTDNTLPNEGLDWLEENLGGRWVQTSYNARIRKNFAGVGHTYDETLDAFIPAQPFASWNLNQDTCQWEAPEPYPTDGGVYIWDEETLGWEVVPEPSEA